MCEEKVAVLLQFMEDWSALYKVDFAMQDCGRSWQLPVIIFVLLLYSNCTSFLHFFQQMHNSLLHILLYLKQILDLQRFVKVVHFPSGMRFAVGCMIRSGWSAAILILWNTAIEVERMRARKWVRGMLKAPVVCINVHSFAVGITWTLLSVKWCSHECKIGQIFKEISYYFASQIQTT